jgi:flagellar basal body-associated protein FliL
MVRKAQLDEIDFDLPPEEDEQRPDKTGEEEKQEAADPGSEELEEGYSEEEAGGRFSFLGEKARLIIFCALGCLLIAGVVWGTWYFVKKGKQTPSLAANTADVQPQEREEVMPSALSEALPSRQMVFQDFMIPIADGPRYRILKINFVVEVVVWENAVQKNDMSYDPGVRRQIVNAIQSQGRDLLTAKNSRELVKNDLLSLMTQILGENTVKNVYITDFTFI